MTVAHREPIRYGPAPWHRHRGVWVEHWRPGVWVHGKTGVMSRGRVTVRVRRCDCGRLDVRESWPTGRRRWVR